MTSVLVTRPAGSTDVLVQALERMGYRVHAVPTVATEPVTFSADSLASFDWVVVTSAQGVNALHRMPAGPRFAAVGLKTADALRARGVQPDHVAPLASGASLADTLPEVNGKRVALVRASAAGSDLPERLGARGAIVELITAYRTIEGPPGSAAAMLDALADPALALAVFASGSAIRGYLALGGTNRVPAVTIGPRTTVIAKELGFQVIAEANERSAESLAAAVAAALPLEEIRNA
ncbi:MAG TPA: uroporphyrinogen-III synthase [Candidatus Dormibacteraeota bacterium]|jgi:uroporphyrinogen-III synthase